MTSLLALLSQKSTGLQTRKGLILTGLQQDFVSPDGKLPVSLDAGYFTRLDRLVTEFREHGDVIWVRTEFESTRQPSEMDDEGCNVITTTGDTRNDRTSEVGRSSPERAKSSKKRKVGSDCSRCSTETATSSRKSDDRKHSAAPEVDRELFLTKTSRREPACLRGSFGADYAKQVRPLIKPSRDLQVVKSYYSAFSSTSLLLSLRSKLITELYIAGCITNLSVYATAMDAARYGIKVVLIEDCLGYRIRERHELAIARLVKVMEAKVLHSTAVIGRLRNPSQCVSEEESESEDDESEVDIDEEDTSDAKISNLLEADSDEEDDEDDDDLPNSDEACGREENAELRQDEVAAAYENVSAASEQGVVPPRVSVSHPMEEETTAPQSTSNSNGMSAAASDLGRQKEPSNTAPTPPLSPTARSDRLVPLLGADAHEASAGSTVTQHLLHESLAATAFSSLTSEVNFQPLYHQASPVPRLVCCQATVRKDGTQPIYRHPSDTTLLSTLWTPTVDLIRLAAEKLCGHELNHCLIQLYRDRKDEIHEHSDKTLDIVPGTFIVNVSFGAERVMRLRSKRSPDAPGAERKLVRVPLKHNSAVLMSLQTNAEWLHGIKADKRRDAEFSEAERAWGGQRISLTFRQIGTWISGDAERIWGQGAKAQTRGEAGKTLRGDVAESERLLRGLGKENAESARDWEAWYGGGSDVLDMGIPRES